VVLTPDRTPGYCMGRRSAIPSHAIHAGMRRGIKSAGYDLVRAIGRLILYGFVLDRCSNLIALAIDDIQGEL